MGFQRRSGPYSAYFFCDTPGCDKSINGDYTDKGLIDAARQQGWKVILAEPLNMWGIEGIAHQTFCPTCAQAGGAGTSSRAPSA